MNVALIRGTIQLECKGRDDSLSKENSAIMLCMVI